MQVYFLHIVLPWDFSIGALDKFVKHVYTTIKQLKNSLRLDQYYSFFRSFNTPHTFNVISNEKAFLTIKIANFFTYIYLSKYSWHIWSLLFSCFPICKTSKSKQQLFSLNLLIKSPSQKFVLIPVAKICSSEKLNLV